MSTFVHVDEIEKFDFHNPKSVLTEKELTVILRALEKGIMDQDLATALRQRWSLPTPELQKKIDYWKWIFRVDK